MKKINRRLGGVVALLMLVFSLTACTGDKSQASALTPAEVNQAKALMQYLAEDKPDAAAALFKEGATITKENPALDYVDQVSGYAYRHLEYGQVFSINGTKEIKSYLQNLVDYRFTSSESQYEYSVGNVSWNSQLFLGHTAIKANFSADFQNNQISSLIITYTDLANLPDRA